jgi:DNA-binding MurR/RpiR family transcriptional regulator
MQNVLLRLREIRPSLSNTEQQIAHFILENPELTTTLTVRQLAQRTFSSPSSVLRICRAVGFEGYKELRRALVEELAVLGERGSHPEQELTAQDSVQELIEKVTQKNIQCLRDTQRLLSPQEVERCAALVRKSRIVMLFGMGASLCVAKDAYLKFLRLNKPCAVNEDWHSQLLQARNATPQDVGIVFSYSGQTVEMIQCMQAMRENGTPIIAVTRYYPSEVAKLADHVLYIAANESLFRNGAMSSRMSQLDVVDILYTLCANADHEATLRRLASTHIEKPGDHEEEEERAQESAGEPAR